MIIACMQLLMAFFAQIVWDQTVFNDRYIVRIVRVMWFRYSIKVVVLQIPALWLYNLYLSLHAMCCCFCLLGLQ